MVQKRTLSRKRRRGSKKSKGSKKHSRKGTKKWKWKWSKHRKHSHYKKWTTTTTTLTTEIIPTETYTIPTTPVEPFTTTSIEITTTTYVTESTIVVPPVQTDDGGIAIPQGNPFTTALVAGGILLALVAAVFAFGLFSSRNNKKSTVRTLFVSDTSNSKFTDPNVDKDLPEAAPIVMAPALAAVSDTSSEHELQRREQSFAPELDSEPERDSRRVSFAPELDSEPELESKPASPAIQLTQEEPHTFVLEPAVSEDIDDMDNLDLKAAPAPTSHVVAIRYVPMNPDEMLMMPGDIVGIEKMYSDGWARGQNISQNRKRCIFPLAILTPITSGPSQAVRARGDKGKEFKEKDDDFITGVEGDIPKRVTSIQRVSNRDSGALGPPGVEEIVDENIQGKDVPGLDHTKTYTRVTRTVFTKEDIGFVKTVVMIYKHNKNIELANKTSYNDSGEIIESVDYFGEDAELLFS
jgi:hypothetical protein